MDLTYNRGAWLAIFRLRGLVTWPTARYSYDVQCKLKLLLIALAFLCARSAFAHGDLHEQIEAVTKQLLKEPKNAELHLKRGELHRAHQEWDKAQADYDRALSLDPGLSIIDYTRGRMFLEADWPHSAKTSLDRFLRRNTNHVEALIARGRALVKLGKGLDAARDFSAAIDHAGPGRPELYIERAQAFTGMGEGYYAEALAGLEQGLKKLGPHIVTLQLYALDVELKQKRFDAALERLEIVAKQSPRKETWLARRGEILQQAGRHDDARLAYEDALQAMDKLPPSRRHVPAMVELERRIKSAIADLPAGRGRPGP